MNTAEQIVDLIRSQNWKNGGVHSIDRDEAISLVEQYAKIVASQAYCEAIEETHKRAMAVLESFVKPANGA